MDGVGSRMKCHEAIAAGIQHIQENKLRAGLSILGILIGIASVLCMMAIGDGAKQIIAEDIEKIGGTNQVQFWQRPSVWKGGRIRHTTEHYTICDALAIEAECPNVIGVLPAHQEFGFYVTNHNGEDARPSVDGVTPDYEPLMQWHIQEGRFITDNDVDNATQVCILGSDVATELFGTTSPLGQEVKIRYRWGHPTIRMRVVGVFAFKGRSLSASWWSLDNTICVPLTTYQQRIVGNRYLERLIIFFQKGADANRIIDSAKEILRKRHRGKDDFIGYWHPKNNIRQLERIEKMIKIALGGIAGFSLLVGGIGIMNICLVSVGEKTREIGLRKSVGARGIDIFYQFLTESICICLCGAILGIIGGVVAAHGMVRVAVRIVPIVEKWPVVLSGHWILISALFSVFMGIAFGVYPAIRAARLSPIDALRTEN
ncbi:ABC transporter permease [Candidatus Poribacteria bacterium]|nr:MAG: ABC transporter permease [Candidatus Poribacteria bacterium]